MFTIQEIQTLMDKMQQTNLGELKLKGENFELKLKAKEPVSVMTAPQPLTATCTYENVETAPVAVQTIITPVNQTAGNVVKSPIVGTFYASAAPDKPPFVTIGKRVKKGDVLFVIESMKLMNEIQSDFDGEVVEICTENAQGVEFNQPIMIIA